MAPDHNPKALEMADRLFPTVGRKRLQMLAEMDPEFCRLFEDFVYAGLYQREVLDQKTRELCAVAALTSLSRLQQLATHIRASLLAGASREEVHSLPGERLRRHAGHARRAAGDAQDLRGA
jgi:4-carboxymuconolactone decarboxylase